MLGYYRNTFLYCFNEINAIRIDKENAGKRVLNLQVFLIKKIVYVEKRLRDCKSKLKGSSDLNNVNYYSQRLDDYRRIRYLLRNVADAIAYIYISRWDIKPQLSKQDAGFISGKSGLKQEITILKAVFEQGYIGVLNDITAFFAKESR